MSRPPSVLVLGGSVAGLALALLCARRGSSVTVLEADAGAVARPFDETVGRDPRWATPQAAHSHAFLGRAVAILRAEAPDVLDDLLAAGARLLPLAVNRPATLPPSEPTPGDDDLAVLLARRTTFEAVLRRVVARETDVTLTSGCAATGLELDRSGRLPRVVGAHGEDGRVRHADVVVDATGRRGEVGRWLVDADVPVEVADADCGIAYHSRFYRLRLGAGWGPLNRGATAGASYDRYSCLVFPGDNDTFSVTFGTLPEDRDLAGLRRGAAFDAAARSLELVAPWVDEHRAEPISPVRTMTRMRNRLRRTARDGVPTVTGFVTLADAAAISNPAHSRGCALALAHAQRLADAIAVSGHDPVTIALAGDRIVTGTLAPWVADSEQQDRARLARWRPDTPLPPAVFDAPTHRVDNGGAYVAAQHDPVVWRAFTRLQQLLVDPVDVLDDEDVAARVTAVREAGLGLPPHVAPDHGELATLLAHHTERVPGGR
ncbi:FAD-dependent oxidoreductase [Nitriliruptoraceae bacterium ZYF776]|nr:FAD-dependent oxidoreductase [Profundirhabdus halotolerans]